MRPPANCGCSITAAVAQASSSASSASWVTRTLTRAPCSASSRVSFTSTRNSSAATARPRLNAARGCDRAGSTRCGASAPRFRAKGGKHTSARPSRPRAPLARGTRRPWCQPAASSMPLPGLAALRGRAPQSSSTHPEVRESACAGRPGAAARARICDRGLARAACTFRGHDLAPRFRPAKASGALESATLSSAARALGFSISGGGHAAAPGRATSPAE